MSWQHPAYREGQHYQQQQYHAPTGQDEYGYTPADGFQGQTYHQSQASWGNGAGYGFQQAPNGALQTPAVNGHYGEYQHGDQTQQQPAAYNPQLYAQGPQYGQQSYSASNPPQTPSRASYNPAAYSGQYAQAQNQASSYQSAQYQQQSYNPSDYASSAYTASPQPGSYEHSPAPSQSHFQSPQVDSHGSLLSPRYDRQSTVPPPVPPRPTSGVQTPFSTYSTYSQPAAQMATSYNPSSANPPYPDYDSNIAMPGYDYMDPQFVAHSPIDELNIPSPPAYTPFTDQTFIDTPVRRHPSVSPLNAPEAGQAPPPPPAHGSSRTSPSVRHPQSRPLPGPPEPDLGPDYFRPSVIRTGTDDFDYDLETQDALFDEVESAVMNAGSPAAHPSSSPGRGSDASQSLRPLFGSHRRRNEASVNGNSPDGERGGDSDAEALAGLEAMRVADEAEKADFRRRQSSTGGFLGVQARKDGYDSDDYANVDMGLYGGGYEANMSYGGAPDALAGAAGSRNSSLKQPSSSGSISMRRPSTHGRGMSYDSYPEPAPPFSSVARVDSGGTGGLIDANANVHRRSFDDGDAYSFTEETIESAGPPDMFFFPDVSPLYRPLPPPPPESGESSAGVVTPASATTPYPLTPSASVHHSQSDIAVPRFISLRERSTTPPVGHPTRSKTDAEERMRRVPGLRTSVEYRNSVHLNLPPTPANNTMTIDLPSLPSKRFNAAKLGASDFKKCEEPWALSAVNQWLRVIANPEQVTELKESMVKEALVTLFTNKVPTMNITDAETLSLRVVQDMYDAGTLRKTEEWVRLAPGPMSGVIFQLSQGGCYSPTLHDHVIPGRCYSHLCQRTLKKVNLQATPTRSGEDWATYYKLKKEDVEGVDKKEIERQNILHEIVQTEDQFMSQTNVLQQVYRDAIIAALPPVVDPKRINAFIRDVFGKIDAVRKANEDHLLAQLKYRQEEQGPWIKGFSDIFRQWIRKAKHAYIEYAAGFPAATLLVRQELERNIEFRNFLDKARANKASNRLGLDTYLKAPITRLQRYSLLLMTVHKSMKDDSDEKKNLQIAIDEVKEVTHECDSRVAEMQRKVDLADLGQKLILRPGMQQDVELNLNHLGRRLIHQGTLLRTGSSRFNWVDSQVLLFDHYMIIAKTIQAVQRGTGARIDKLDVSRFPIPMDLLALESINDDPVRQSHYTRGLSTVSTVPKGAPGNEALRARAGTTTSPTPLSERASTSASLSSLNSTVSAPPTTTITDAAKDSEKILYPFKIRHLGRDAYTLFVQSNAQRQEWGTKIIEAKTQHAKSLYRQNAEPFRLRVIADSAFAYESYMNTSGSKPIVIEDTPMDRAIKEVDTRYSSTGRPAPICRAKVNCSASFMTPYPGKHMTAVGTDFGVYISEIDNPRGWTKSIAMPRVTQIAVLEEFNVFLLISAGSLIAYHLDVVTTPVTSNSSNESSSARRAPQKLSGTKDVGFFAVGRMKERTLVFYKKRDGLSSTFKVLEPVFQKSSEKKRGMFKRANTEFFRDFDEFYIPTECSGINLFSSSLSVSTSRGFEVLTLDKKQTFSVPDLRAPEVANIAQHIEGQATLGMLRLSEQEFLLCYEKCAVYVNKHGDVSRSVIMNFVGKAKSAALYGPYLLLFDADFVEVRNAQNGRLKQIISGRDVRCLDDGGGGSLSGGSTNPGVVNGTPLGMGSAARTVKVAMCHPVVERNQVVVELVLNEGLKEG